MDFASFTGPAVSEVHPVVADIKALIYHKYNNHPRTLQEELGPSEIGEPCMRRLAYNIMNEPRVNDSDPLPSIVGTAAHAWMEDACRMWNEKAGQTIWVPEATLKIAPGIDGHCDAYYVPRRLVVDWKFPGTEPMRGYRNNGPSIVYRKQAHLYGKGYADLGVPVDEVGIAFFSRGGNLNGKYGLHFWSEPYDPRVAEEALNRYFRVAEIAKQLNVSEHPEKYGLFPMDPDAACGHCPQLDKNTAVVGRTCPGLPKEPAKKAKKENSK